MRSPLHPSGRPLRSASLAAILAVVVSGCAPLLGSGGIAPAPQGRLAAALEQVFADTALAHAHWGVEIRSLDTGEILYSQNAERLFVPASNVKLVTAAAALEALGPEFRYETSVLAGGAIQGGVLRGPLVVRGGGDPTLSRRFHEDPRDAFRMWADSLRAQGVTRIEGPIIGVDSAFVGPRLGPGWAWDDIGLSDSPEFGALQFNENLLTVQLVPSRNLADPAVVILSPATQFVQLNNQTVTAPAGTPTRIAFQRDLAGPGLTISGSLAADSGLVERTISIHDPARYFVTVLRETLREEGIAVEGPAIMADEWPEGMRRPLESQLFVHTSPPVREILPAMLKPSQNLLAETLLTTVGQRLRGEGSLAAGTLAADSMMTAWGMNPRNRRVVDGSGLSRYNLLAPEDLIVLLAHMDRSGNREVFHSSLPVAGVDGTLARRMMAPPLERNVHAKTGTLGGIRALSGYVTTVGGERLAFSMLVNNHRRSAAAADAVIDAALLRLVTVR